MTANFNYPDAESSAFEDWSALTVNEAGLEDLDSGALLRAREYFGRKNPHLAEVAKDWSSAEFLEQAKLTLAGKITHTTLLLLGREEAARWLSPVSPKIRWLLREQDNSTSEYAIHGLPFLKSMGDVLGVLKNPKFSYVPQNSIYPVDIEAYEPRMLREALYNCVAHQNYRMAGIINVVEYSDRLIFTNAGYFIPGTVESLLLEKSGLPEQCRNPFLLNAMVGLGLVAGAGLGIRRMFNAQWRRHFPLPDFVFKEGRVCLTITGKIIDPNYVNLLNEYPNLGLEEVFWLDKVQKHQIIPFEIAKVLKSKNYARGRYPHLYLGNQTGWLKPPPVAKSTNYRKIARQPLRDIILDALKEKGSLTRHQIGDLLGKVLPDDLDKDYRCMRITYIVRDLSSRKVIINRGSRIHPIWVLNDGQENPDAPVVPDVSPASFLPDSLPE
ncbi:MAG: hypothetical protein LBU79_01460 [Planctomycetota bacterium]|jgi:ATP-dependent DNA helicase RecG|nr:hypothetical protein [Planctomycetota bacterium]